MFDANEFKRSVKEWMRKNPEGSEADLVDFCEERIPPAQFSSHHWLVDHTLSWYRHILSQRQVSAGNEEDEDLASV